MASKKSKFSKNTDAKKSIVAQYGSHEGDSGSPMEQIALLTERINYLTDHLQSNRKDKHSRRGLLKLVGARRKMVKYLRKTNKDEEEIVKFLNKMGLK